MDDNKNTINSKHKKTDFLGISNGEETEGGVTGTYSIASEINNVPNTMLKMSKINDQF